MSCLQIFSAADVFHQLSLVILQSLLDSPDLSPLLQSLLQSAFAASQISLSATAESADFLAVFKVQLLFVSVFSGLMPFVF